MHRYIQCGGRTVVTWKFYIFLATGRSLECVRQLIGLRLDARWDATGVETQTNEYLIVRKETLMEMWMLCASRHTDVFG